MYSLDVRGFFYFRASGQNQRARLKLDDIKNDLALYAVLYYTSIAIGYICIKYVGT